MNKPKRPNPKKDRSVRRSRKDPRKFKLPYNPYVHLKNRKVKLEKRDEIVEKIEEAKLRQLKKQLYFGKHYGASVKILKEFIKNETKN